MVVSTILACFLNNMFNFEYLSFIFWIRDPYGTPKIIFIFIFLSSYPAFISNIIFEGEQSLKLRSTPSRLRFVHPPPIPLPPPSPSPPRFASSHTQIPRNEPLPSIGMWAQIQMQHIRKCRPCCIRPSPFQRDVGSSMEGMEEGKESERKIHKGRPM